MLAASVYTPLQLVLALSSFVVQRPALKPSVLIAQRPALVPRRAAAPGCCAAPDLSGTESYTVYWEQLLQREYRETADQLRDKRAKWSQKRLEASGLGVFGASATPDNE